MNCIQKQQLVSFPKVRIWKPWFRHFNNHKEFRNEGTVHLFSLMALFSYANFRSNERMIIWMMMATAKSAPALL